MYTYIHLRFIYLKFPIFIVIRFVLSIKHEM